MQVEQQVFQNDLLPFMSSHNMRGWHYTRQQSECQETQEGVALFYSATSFKCLDVQQLCLANVPACSTPEARKSFFDDGTVDQSKKLLL